MEVKRETGFFGGVFREMFYYCLTAALPTWQKVEQMVIKGTKYRRYEQF
jgi:hypothetical protein